MTVRAVYPVKEPSISCFYVRPSSIVWGQVVKPHTKFCGITYQSLIRAQEKKEGFEMSRQSSKRLFNSIDWFVASAKDKWTYCKIQQKAIKYKIAFITLTLPAKQIHSDEEIKKNCLNQFLTELKSYHNVKQYIWRAEAQKNGNIHFHITIKTYIHYKKIQDIWNRCIGKLGYLERFAEKFKHFEPHTTEIKSVKKIKNIARYLVKYLTKKNSHSITKDGVVYTSRNITGKKFGQSQSLSAIKSLRFDETEEEYNEIKDCVTSQPIKTVYADYCTIFYANWNATFENFPCKTSSAYNRFIDTFT